MLPDWLTQCLPHAWGCKWNARCTGAAAASALLNWTVSTHGSCRCMLQTWLCGCDWCPCLLSQFNKRAASQLLRQLCTDILLLHNCCDSKKHHAAALKQDACSLYP